MIFDEPTAVLTPQEIDELMKIMKELIKEGKSIIFITHKLNEIKAVADRCTIIRKGRYVGTVNVADVTKEQLSEMMVGHKVNLTVTKDEHEPSDVVLKVDHLSYQPKTSDKLLLNDVSFEVRKGEIVCIAGIDGNGQSELIYNLTGLEQPNMGHVYLNDEEITHKSIRYRNDHGLSHIPEDRHKHGLVLDYTLGENLILKSYYKKDFQNHGIIKFDAMNKAVDGALVTNQIEWNPVCFEHFNSGMMDYLTVNKIHPMIWSPLAGGRLFQEDDLQCKKAMD